MIKLYSGTPGSGKSLHLASYLYYRVKNHRGLVICNFEINLDNIKGKNKKSRFMCVTNDNLTPEFLMLEADKYAYEYEAKHRCHVPEGELLIVIDESQLMFNSRDWQQTRRNDWLSFFTQHRKYGYDIILVAQFDRMLDRQIRSLIEYEWVHRKINNYGIPGMILGFLSFGSLFVCVKVWYPMKDKVGSEFFKGNKKYFRLYDTRRKFETIKD